MSQTLHQFEAPANVAKRCPVCNGRVPVGARALIRHVQASGSAAMRQVGMVKTLWQTIHLGKCSTTVGYTPASA